MSMIKFIFKRNYQKKINFKEGVMDSFKIKKIKGRASLLNKMIKIYKFSLDKLKEKVFSKKVLSIF